MLCVLLAVAGVDLVVQTGHADRVYSGTYSPDGRLVATGSRDTTVKLSEVASGKLLRTFAGHSGDVTSVEFSPDGKALLSAAGDGKVRLWEVATGALLGTFSSSATMARFSPDGQTLALGDTKNTVTIVDLNGKELRAVSTWRDADQRVSALAFSGDGRLLASSVNMRHDVVLFDARTGKELRVLKGHNNGVSSMQFARDNRTLFTGSHDQCAKQWDTETGQVIRTFARKPPKGAWLPTTSSVLGVSLSPDQRVLATAWADGVAVLYDVATGKELRTIEAHRPDATAIVFSPDGKRLLTTGYDQTAKLWDVASGKLLMTLSGETHPVHAVSFSPDDRLALMGSDGQTGKLWDLRMGKQTPAPGEALAWGSAAAFLRDGKSVITSTWGLAATSQWDLQSGALVRKLKSGEGADKAMALGRDKIAISARYSVGVWDLATGGLIRRFEPERQAGAVSLSDVNAARLSPDGKTLLLASSWTSMLLDIATGAVVRRLPPSQLAGFSPDGTRIITKAYGKPLELSSTDTGALLSSFAIHGSFAELSPDGTQVVTAGEDNTAVIWEVATGKRVRELRGHATPVATAAFSHDGQRVLTGSFDNTSKLWAAQTGELVCTFVSLGASEWAAVLPDGHYMSSKSAGAGLHFVAGLNRYTLESLDLLLNRPDLVVQALGGDDRVIESYNHAYLRRLKKLGFDPGQVSADMHLPEVVVQTVADETKSRTLVLHVSASDSKYDLDRIAVSINGVPVFGSAGVPVGRVRSVTREISVELERGRNSIGVAVLNSKGAESLQQPVVVNYVAPARKPDLYIVSIGVSHYANAEMDLQYAAKDASDLVKAFAEHKKAFGKIKTVSLQNGAATREAILASKDFLRGAEVDDQVVVFAAGHGLLDDKLEWYFATPDTDFSSPAARGLSYAQLEGLLDAIPARKKLLLVDACNSGEVDKQDNVLVASNASSEGVVKVRGFKSVKKQTLGLLNSFDVMQDLFTSLQRGSGAMVISSASGAEYALESAEWNNGVFTYALLQGLKGKRADANKDGIVRVSELRNYVTEKVDALTAGRQHPTSRRQSSELDFAVAP